MRNPFCPLLPGNFYHVYSRAVGDEKLFRSDENYRYFFFKLLQYIYPVAQIWTYSLMPNHFHILIKVRDYEIIEEYFEFKYGKKLDPSIHSSSRFIMQQFSNFLNGYAKAYNKMYQRKGALFMDYIRRSEAKNDEDITSFIFYIHKNAVHHNLASHIGEWKFDGYQAITGNYPTDIEKRQVIEWFGSLDLLKKFHKQPVELRSGVWDFI